MTEQTNSVNLVIGENKRHALTRSKDIKAIIRELYTKASSLRFPFSIMSHDLMLVVEIKNELVLISMMLAYDLLNDFE